MATSIIIAVICVAIWAYLIVRAGHVLARERTRCHKQRGRVRPVAGGCRGHSGAQ